MVLGLFLFLFGLFSSFGFVQTGFWLSRQGSETLRQGLKSPDLVNKESEKCREGLETVQKGSRYSPDRVKTQLRQSSDKVQTEFKRAHGLGLCNDLVRVWVFVLILPCPYMVVGVLTQSRHGETGSRKCRLVPDRV